MTACTAQDSAYRFRYDGLDRVLQSGGQSFLLPKAWNHRDGVALVLPRSGDVRLEFCRGRRSGSARAEGRIRG